MIIKISIDTKDQIRPTTFNATISQEITFPIAVIGEGCYIVSADIQSGIDFDVEAGVCNLQIGKYSALADGITFLINVNHDYDSIVSGSDFFLKKIPREFKIRRKGQLVIKNDCWIGHGATIMSGVTVHNGAVVAAKSMVVKDVPPYAIVGGNPAKIIKYRFTEEQIQKLETIAWWRWDREKINACKHSFLGEIDEFIDEHYQEALDRKNSLHYDYEKTKPIMLFIPDFYDAHPVYKNVIRQYCRVYGDDDQMQLLIYIKNDEEVSENMQKIEDIISEFDEGKGEIIFQVDDLPDEEPLFTIADQFIATRNVNTVKWLDYAHEHGVKIISGVDSPIF